MASVPSVMYSPSPGVYSIIPVASVPFTGGLTTPLQASVANPAVGFATIFVNNSEQLSVTDAVGNTYQLLDNPASQDQDMNNHLVGGIQRLAFNAGIIAGNGPPTAGDADGIAIGNGSSAGTGGSVALGLNAAATGGASTAVGPAASATAASAIAIGAAANGTANTCLIGDVAIANIRSNSSTNACDLGTSAAPFKTCWLRDAQPASGTKFVQYSTVSLANSNVETSLLTGTTAGSLVYSANQALGSIIRLTLNFVISVAVADTLTFRIKANGGLLILQAVGAAAFAAAVGRLVVDMVVQAATISCTALVELEGATTQTHLSFAGPGYNPAIANTLSITGQWSAADPGDVLQLNNVYIETLRAL